MNFFVTYDYNYQLSGIEQAQFKRLKALKNFGSSIVTLAYNRFLYDIKKKIKLETLDLINMYDYFQGVWNNTELICQLERKEIKDLLTEDEYVENINQNQYVIYRKRSHTKTIYLFSGDHSEYIDRVDYFDNYGSKIKTDFYDIRGFLSMSDIYGQRGGVAREINYDLFGNSVLESYYRVDSDGEIYTNWILNFKSKQYFLSKKEQLETIFLDALNREFDNNNLFISDRAYKTDVSLIKMTTSRKLFVYWHNVFVPENGIANKTKPFDTLLFEIENSDKIDGLLAATNQEVADLKIATSNKIDVFKLNSYILNDFDISSDQMAGHYKYDIITVARIFPEKRILLGIEMINKLIKINSNVHWDIFGYGDSSYLKKVKTAIIEKGLSENITIHPYTKKLEEVYSQARIFWMLSKFEGFNMSQAEAQSYGVPVIAFDIDYGPRELIENQKSGFLIENNDVVSFIKATNKLLTDTNLYLQMRIAAKQNIQHYDKNHFISQWNKICEI
ncbi:glycosyltransferase [Fructobacillus tropaeoli]|uniref:glycosyltransferase n=1 Tax=Fructobacillus tropaeoli TaxID=709323 RepID=UPI001944523A|nr:glycosyltransferase [Fructobacillus tropaeoli]GIC70881.1 glycosyltransferase [Fructobacillus tropaeoli]CAK1255037.1 Glycosyltransferase involved in cell wall bisynthesis (RfaB) [Fructobacillus tropaeoli]